jgi:hypothetical protein
MRRRFHRHCGRAFLNTRRRHTRLPHAGECTTRAQTFLFFVIFYILLNIKLPLRWSNNNKNNHCEKTQKPLNNNCIYFFYEYFSHFTSIYIYIWLNIKLPHDWINNKKKHYCEKHKITPWIYFFSDNILIVSSIRNRKRNNYFLLIYNNY